MKPPKRTSLTLLTLAITLLVARSLQAGLLETQDNPVSGFDPYTLANWSGLPQYPTDTSGDGTTEGYDMLYIQAAHDDSWFYIHYHNTASFGGELQFMYLDTDLNASTGLNGFTGNLAVGAEYYLDGASLWSTAGGGTFTGYYVGWNQQQDIGTGNWDIEIAIDRAQLPGVTGFDFVAQEHGSSGDDWYPATGNSGASGDYFRYTTVAVPEPASVTLMGMGIISLLAVARRRQK